MQSLRVSTYWDCTARRLIREIDELQTDAGRVFTSDDTTRQMPQVW